MIRRLLLFALTLNLAVTATGASAQQPNKIPVVGFLMMAAGPEDGPIQGDRKSVV